MGKKCTKLTQIFHVLATSLCYATLHWNSSVLSSERSNNKPETRSKTYSTHRAARFFHVKGTKLNRPLPSPHAHTRYTCMPRMPSFLKDKRNLESLLEVSHFAEKIRYINIHAFLSRSLTSSVYNAVATPSSEFGSGWLLILPAQMAGISRPACSAPNPLSPTKTTSHINYISRPNDRFNNRTDDHDRKFDTVSQSPLSIQSSSKSIRLGVCFSVRQSGLRLASLQRLPHGQEKRE